MRPARTAVVVIVLSLVVAVVAVVTIRAVGNHASGRNQVLPLSTWSAPAGVVAGTPATSEGNLYVLANTSAAANVQSIDTATGRVNRIIAVSNTARSLAVSDTGILAVGTASGVVGSMAFLSSRGTHLGVVALPGPAQQIVSEADGRSFLAFVSDRGTASAVVVNSADDKVVGVTPLSNTSLSVAVSPDGTTIYDLLSTGVVQVISTQSGKSFTNFAVPAGGRALALSADGSMLYELKGAPSDDNVAAIDASTQQVTSVLPAPADTVSIAPSLTKSQIYDFVGTPHYSNVQLFAVHS